MMTDRTIAMDGAAWLASFVASFPTKSAWVKDRLKSSAFADKPQEIRAKMFEQVYDLAVPPKKNHIETK